MFARHRHRLLSLLVLAVLAACGGGSDSAPAPPTASPAPGSPPAAPLADCGLPDFRAEALRAINAARATARSCGSTAAPAVAALAWSAALERAAATHAHDMAANGYFAHQGLDGRNVGERASAAGYAWRSVGENIAFGQAGIADVM